MSSLALAAGLSLVLGPVVLLVYMCAAVLLAVTIGAAWFLSLLLGVALATDAVDDVKNAANEWKPGRGAIDHRRRGNWYELVQRPALELVNTTLPSLSAWGTTIFASFVTSWAFALLSIPLAADEFNDHSSSWVRRLYLAAVVFVQTTMPFMLLYAPARVSSAVIELLNQLNELRVRSEHADKDALRRMERAARLHQYLISLNNRKGPGFIIGNTVVDLVFMKQLVGMAIGFGSSVVVYLAHLGGQHASDQPLANSSSSTCCAHIPLTDGCYATCMAVQP